MDLTSAAQAFSVSTKVSEPSSARNYDFSESDYAFVTFGAISTEDQSERHQNGRTGQIDFDSDPTTSLPYAINPSPRRWNFRKTKSRQNAETGKCMGDGSHAGKVSLDFNMLNFTRGKRSCFRKRARASPWGLLSNLQLDFVKHGDRRINLTEHENSSRSRGQASGKQKKNQPKNHHLTEHEKQSRSRGQASGKQKKNQPKGHSTKFRRKRSHRTVGISVKFKAGVGVGSWSIMDGSNGRPFEIMGKTPNLPKEENLTNSMMSKGFKANMKRMAHLSDDTTHDVGKYVVENISNPGSDLGTSPDSEVINVNLDTSLWDNSEEEFHNLSGSSHICVASDCVTCLVPKNSQEAQKQIFMGRCSAGDKLTKSGIVDDIQSAEPVEIAVDVPYSINVSPPSSSVFAPGNTSNIEWKYKEHSSSPDNDIELPCLPSTDIGTEVTPIVGPDLQFPVLQVSAKVHLHSKGQKILKEEKRDGVTKSTLESHVSANKGRRDSRKKVKQHEFASKRTLKVKLRGGLTSSKAGKQAGPGDSKLAVLGESGTAKSSLTGYESTFNVVPRGFTEQSKRPRNAWVLCDDCQKWRRISATLADHLEETNCSWTCKDNVDKNFGNCSIPQEKSDAQINTELEISDASCVEGVWDARLNSNSLGENRSTVAQRSTWKLIKSNQFLHRRQQTQNIDEIMVCHCKPPFDGRMGCGDGCLNRMLNIECVQGTCPCGELCSNRQFQKRNYARLRMFKCGKKGYGVQVLDNISEGQFLIEYVGEVLDMHSYEARQRDYAMQGHKHFYFMTLNGSEVIDARAKGNLGRFINHSCDPNCRTEKWVVNGEVCIGLFALKNIQKGEELTFDYNYVRVFGAAVKKCVCESSQCRGYIGGQSQDTEIVVQDDSEDEYSEPIMVFEDGAVDESYPNMRSPQSTFDCIGAMPEMEPQNDESVDVMSPHCFATSLQAVETGISKKFVNITSVVEHEDTIEKSLDPLNNCGSTDLKVDTSKKTELSETFIHFEVVLKQDDISTKTLVTGEPESLEAGENMKQSTLEENSANTVLNQLPPDVVDNKRKPKSGRRKRSIKSPVTKASRLTSLINSESAPVNVQKMQETQGKDDALSFKPKKEVEVSSTARSESVQEKLNELLNLHGGISKRKDASKGYLKLLLLTAASRDSCNGEAIQSNRDLSMILGALLETKSRTVLVDIINKNGLQMLHNMLKQSRKEFNKIPILRKLLKVFEYLATREILTSEHISGGPNCPGVESFTESILSLTEHVDKQVHQIARSFRDRWIPGLARRHQREERVVDFCRSSVHKQWSNQFEKHLETRDSITKSVVTPSTFDAGIVEVSCQSSGSARNTRKRKSQWDQSEDLNQVDIHMSDDGMNSIDNDHLPGFAAPCNPTVVSSEVCSYSSQRSITTDLNRTCQVVSGQPQSRFISCLPVSYGVPIGLVNQVGMPQAATLEDLSVAPGMPFHPFPPLPPYPHNTRPPASNAIDSAVMGPHDQNRSISYNSAPKPPIPQEASMPALEKPGTVKELNLRQPRGTSTLRRRYFRPRKWNSSKLGPPWIRNRYNRGFT
ncbi:hypothetical protein Leryth_003160 [Lithospermum erythrorhizon]|nr:hypothetical protein Leryth_003160 [Lithospermum erythrorhizon]